MKREDLAALRKELGIKAVPVHSGAWSESQHQQALMRWCQLAKVTRPELAWIYSVPNGGYRSAATAGRMRGEGVKAGVFDLGLDCARHGFHGLKIEMKTPRTPGLKGSYKAVQPGKPSPEQLAWLAHYTAEGYKAEFCFGWLEAKSLLEWYLTP